WDAIRSLVAAGCTVLLTTQNLEEADQLADRISVVDAGRVVAAGTPDQLKARIGADRVEVVVRDPAQLPVAAGIVARVGTGEPDLDPDTRRLSVPVTDRVGALTAVARGLADAGIVAADLGLRQPTLDEAFLQLTGHHTGEEGLR
ncbi:MAG: daunorubicin/doxorubicin resistance ABC transporter ATP-binding protein DrrA, partial [Natronosporangium sp.]